MKEAPTIIAKIRGFQYFHADGAYCYASLEMGDGVLLIRERDNEVDGNAIRVDVPCPDHKCDDHSCGYIDRDSAKQMARWIDAGWLYTGVITREPNVINHLIYLKLEPTPEAEVKCTPIPPLTMKQKRKQYDKV